jgi:hypothetical protein
MNIKPTLQKNPSWEQRGNEANAELESLTWVSMELAKRVNLSPGLVMILEDAVKEITKHLRDEIDDIRAEGKNCWNANAWLSENEIEV